jgi:hypothetical protein
MPRAGESPQPAAADMGGDATQKRTRNSGDKEPEPDYEDAQFNQELIVDNTTSSPPRKKVCTGHNDERPVSHDGHCMSRLAEAWVTGHVINNCLGELALGVSGSIMAIDFVECRLLWPWLRESAAGYNAGDYKTGKGHHAGCYAYQHIALGAG